MTPTDPKFIIRYPAELRAKVAASAKANHRSINAEIVHQLEKIYTAQANLNWIVGPGKPVETFDREIARMDSMAGNS
ncbi:Arc family DNA-binding protein [Mesorhizobium sp. ESP-6-2]|uniref:Arc family DNA-binding protein n=1 Tax=Mesorhizobium sp. ESP-6-2 TaxID=2876625 RepID=UPI001CCCCCCC|nr:Arc family DNA-binding protein [Mesorhizobium sp. ESP-6-2]MBZ9807658.1 Arc family DNA-binding protein [Mesorhizobium sp. ESP-6-2]